MAYNKNFYNNFQGSTFQSMPNYVPPPPTPPAFFIPPNTRNGDDEFIKQFDSIPPRKPKLKSPISISTVRDEMYTLMRKLKELKSKESVLMDNINNLSDEDWNMHMVQIEENKNTINKILSKLKSLNLDLLQKLVAKRSAKRARLRRKRAELKREKEEWLKEMQEKSRKIDEKLQKTQDDIKKAKQEEKAKIQADIVLKETLRKKHDAKKYIVKLDALMKLRRARMNTAKGRGEAVSEVEAEAFHSKIENLKTLWKHRLSIYESEESQLRATLDASLGEKETAVESERAAAAHLEAWQQAMFGGAGPQVEFADVAEFVSVRCEWDEYLSCEGSPLPVGWVPPRPSAVNIS